MVKSLLILDSAFKDLERKEIWDNVHSLLMSEGSKVDFFRMGITLSHLNAVGATRCYGAISDCSDDGEGVL